MLIAKIHKYRIKNHSNNGITVFSDYLGINFNYLVICNLLIVLHSNDHPHIKILQGIPSSITYINNQQRTMQLLIEKKITNNGIVPASRISCAPFKSKLSFCNN